MKFKKKLRRGVACGLCVCLAGTCTPVPAYAARTADVSAIENVLARAAEYVQTFETADVSNWVSQANPSTIQVIDGKLDMETDEGNESKVPQCALRYDKNSPDISTGELSADFEVKSHAGRFAFVFHYKDSSNYDAVGYDLNGVWRYFHMADGKLEELSFDGPQMNEGAEANIKITFGKKSLNVVLDGNTIYHNENTRMHDSGKLGLRTWGYAGNYAHIAVDTISYAEKDIEEAEETSAILENPEIKLNNLEVTAGTTELLWNNEGSSPKDFDFGPGGSDLQDTSIEYDYGSTVTVDGIDFIGWWPVEQGLKEISVFYDENGEWKPVQEHYVIPWKTTSGSGATADFAGGEKLRMDFAKKVATAKLKIQIHSTYTKWGTKVNMRLIAPTGSVSKYFAPNSVYVRYEEAGTYDVETTLLNEENALKQITADGKALTKGVDYTADGTKVVIKKEFIEKVKTAGDTSLRFEFADGSTAVFVLQIQLPPEENVTYLHDFSKDGLGNMQVVSGNGSAAMDGKTLKVEGGSGTIVIDKDSPKLLDEEVEFSFDPKNDNANFGVILRYANENSWTYIGQDGAGNEFGSDWYVRNSSGSYRRFAPDSEVNRTDSARIYAKRVQPYKVKVRAVGDVVTIFLDEAEIFHGVVPEMTKDRGYAGVRFHGNAGGNIQYLSVSTSLPLVPEVIKEAQNEKIKSDALTVTMDKNFPRVIDYTLAENGKKMYGQELPYYVVEINTKAYRPEVTSEFKDGQAVYHMSVNELGITFDVVFTVENNVLSMDIKNVDDRAYTVHTINFPNHSLVSMRNTEPNAKFYSANYKIQKNYSITTKAADETFNTTSIATLSSDNIAASMANNSIKNRQEVAYQTINAGDHTSTALWSNEYMYKGMLDHEVIAEPWAKVTITADRNKDGKITYQDAAIAYRDDVAEERIGTDIVQDSYSYIAMNVGSAAQYPFLRILDNIKKFSLATDNFGQAVIIKGYQSEGHDSAHPDYGNIGDRQGGKEDFKVLLEESEKYNASIGVHINHTESYPESKYFAQVASSVNGWTWYDDAKQIIRENDILNEESGMAARLDELKENAPGLDWVYVDVYGDGRWPSHKLSKKLHENGWAIASEYDSAMSNTAIWGHHISSTHNGTGNLLHFVNHQTQEIFGNSTLFRGQQPYRVNGFNGWQGASDYNATIKSFFTELLPNRYLMHFPVSQWEKSTEIVFGYDNEVVSSVVSGKNVITKDGKTVANGNKIFIPWSPDTEEKIYHWTDADGVTEWEVPDSWSGVTTAYLYKLTDEGKCEETAVAVSGGKVQLNTKANTGYVLYKEKAAETEDMNWSEGSPVKDMGFDSHTWGYAWEKSSSAGNTDHVQMMNNNKGNTTLRVSGNNGADAVVSQTMTGLKPGQTYSASVWMEVSDGRHAAIQVETPNGAVVSNYTDRSNVVYGVTHNDKLNTNYQRVKVLFKQPEGETTAEIKLIVDAGKADSWANLDDVRVMKVGVTDQGNHYFFEDFENVDQGYGPFTTPKSDNSHLSETNEPYTNDTIDGRFSFKVRNGDYMRTLPHTIRFQPNTTYEVGLDCLAKVDRAFRLQVRSDKAKEAGDTANATAATAYSVKDGQIKVEFTTGNYDDYYIDMTKYLASEYIVDNLYVDIIGGEALEKTEFTVKVDGRVVETGAYNTKVTIAAPAAPEGKVFTGWKLNGKVVSTEPSYTFYIAGDMNFEACYDEGKAAPAAMLAGTQIVKGSDGKADLKFVAQLAVPEGYTVLDAGLLWLTNDNETVWGTADGIAEGVKVTPIKSMNRSGQFSVTIKGVPAGRFVRGVVYARVTNGEETFVYSPEQKVVHK